MDILAKSNVLLFLIFLSEEAFYRKKRTNKELPPPPPSLSPHQGSQQLTLTVIAITRADRHCSNTATTATAASGSLPAPTAG